MQSISSIATTRWGDYSIIIFANLSNSSVFRGKAMQLSGYLAGYQLVAGYQERSCYVLSLFVPTTSNLVLNLCQLLLEKQLIESIGSPLLRALSLMTILLVQIISARNRCLTCLTKHFLPLNRKQYFASLVLIHKHNKAFVQCCC